MHFPISRTEPSLIGRTDRAAADSGKTRDCAFKSTRLGARTLSLLEDTAQLTWSFAWLSVDRFYLPREFTSTIITAAYIPPDADAKAAMNGLYEAISKQQTAYPEAAFNVAGDFNHSNLKTVLPKFHQHVSCQTRGDKTLDHVYTNIVGALHSNPPPPSGTV
ncbi:hypothetical protein L3Q82_016467 [Scortum barcoo]|uniref:Uncharacterized protein n=1 Tax=Scortum barcoo TaxID=214431 RepID=A0ACB8X9I6_9TELE|nr:hypothetical protein L3Q82_016467 [Scortum barcoo]